MQISYKDIVLRDYTVEDIEDDIRWMTVEIAWHDWDAPWEAEEDLRGFDGKKFRAKMLKHLAKKPPAGGFRWSFEIETKGGVHIGGVNSYLIDQEYNWIPGRKGKGWHTLGIDVCESSYWRQGYGTQALVAFICYFLAQGITEIYTQTWSGNRPMVGLAEKIGFEECHRIKDCRVVKGDVYDGLTFKLNLGKFTDFLTKPHEIKIEEG